MKKGFWIFLSIALFLLNVFSLKELRDLRKGLFLRNVNIEGPNGKVSIPFKESFLTLIIYFSERSCEVCMEEVYYWNKLLKDMSKEEVSIVGLIPKNEDIKKVKNRKNILFPIYHDEKGMLYKRLHIPITPFKIIIDRKGKVLYMSPSFEEKDLQKSFYFEVLELLTKVRVRDWAK